jgi:hypothetical protein
MKKKKDSMFHLNIVHLRNLKITNQKNKKVNLLLVKFTNCFNGLSSIKRIGGLWRIGAGLPQLEPNGKGFGGGQTG